ncbi:MAG: HPr family phosphocarrier protein [Eubacteriales bacterium]|nr:HPr family phosphocarrier protein [Eubacteriales bacterium]
MQAKELTITNADGLRASRAAMFVQVAGRFASQILVEKGNKKINAKSIMGVLSLGVKQGEKIYVFADGKDEEDAVAAIEKLIATF